MVVRLHTMDGKTKIYDTYRGEGGGENGPSKYVTKCGMEWKIAPKPYETCDHIDCAIDVQRREDAGGLACFLIFLVIGAYPIFIMKERWMWSLAISGLYILIGVWMLIVGFIAKDKFNELTEYKSKGTINGIRVHKAPASEELAELTNAKECIDMGLFLYDKGKYDDAIKAFYKAIGLNPNSAAAWNSKGVTLKAQNRFDEAIAAYDKAIEFNPQLADAWYNKGRALDDQDKYGEAIITYDRAIEINPRLGGAWYNKGLTLSNQGKYDEAIQAYNKAIEIDPKDADVWYNKGMALKGLGRTTEADATFADAIEKWNSEGMDLSRLEKYAEAIKAYKMALAVDPNYLNSWINKGTAFFRLGMHENAIAAFNQVIKIDPQNADAWNRKGVVLKKIGHKVEATDAFAKAKELGYTG